MKRRRDVDAVAVDHPVHDLDLAALEPLEFEGIPEAPRGDVEVDGDGRHCYQHDDDPPGSPKGDRSADATRRCGVAR